MKITTAAPSDLDEAVSCLAAAFAQDPITEFLLQTGSGSYFSYMQMGIKLEPQLMQLISSLLCGTVESSG